MARIAIWKKWTDLAQQDDLPAWAIWPRDYLLSAAWFLISVVLGLLLIAGCAGPGAEGPNAGLPYVDSPGPTMYYTALSGKEGYAIVFEKTLAVLKESGFDVFESNRYDGRIQSLPRISPGVGRWFMPGSPDVRQRWLATFQSIRHRAFVQIHPANQGGFHVQITVLRELEDLPRPVRSTAGAAVFQYANNVDRQYDIIDPTILETNWLPKGRDVAYEELIMSRLKCEF